MLINSKEQMIAEKLRSLLKFGQFSTRFKDIFDIYYYCDRIDTEAFLVCMNSFVFSNPEMRENNIEDVYKRLSKIFQDQSYKSKVDNSDKRWIDDDIDVVLNKILQFIASIE